MRYPLCHCLPLHFLLDSLLKTSRKTKLKENMKGQFLKGMDKNHTLRRKREGTRPKKGAIIFRGPNARALRH